MPGYRLTPELLQAAVEGLEAQKQRIDDQIAEIKARLGRRGPGRPPKAVQAPTKKKRILSAAARKNISAAQKKRWAASRKGKKTATS